MTAARITPRIAEVMEAASAGTGSFTDADRIIAVAALASIAESLELITDNLDELIEVDGAGEVIT